MNLLFICIQLFTIRLIDITIGTIRTLFIVKNKNIIASICGFFEVLIWFYAVDSALNNGLDSIWIPIAYAAGYSVGTLLGTSLAKIFLNPLISVQIISKQITKENINLIKNNGYGLSIIKLENNKSKLVIIETHHHQLKKLSKLMNKIDNKAFIYINDIRNHYKGYFSHINK